MAVRRSRHWLDELHRWEELGHVLYVGAHGLRGRVPALVAKLRPKSKAVDCIEVFPENVTRVLAMGVFDTVRCGDVRDLGPEDLAPYDTFVWWHGPEHVPFADGVRVLSTVPCNRVWVGCPRGTSPQSQMYGNPHEEHVSAWFEVDFARLGYHYQCYRIRSSYKLSAWRTTHEPAD